MRRERVFSKGGFYNFLVESNALLHREAIAHGVRTIKALDKLSEPNVRLRVLDLACGGLPISISSIMGECSHVLFDYTGVDINPDQVEFAANEFTFPENVVTKRIIEGDAWTLDYLNGEKFDIVFIGLNLHHGSPRECLYLMKQIHALLGDTGVFINHDSYRPDGTPYYPRPATKPGSPSETFSLVSSDLLHFAEIADAHIGEISTDYDWRIPFTEKLESVLSDRGGDRKGIRSVTKHILELDYSLTTGEMTAIAASAGLKAELVSYLNSPEPMRDYYQMLVFRKAPSYSDSDTGAFQIAATADDFEVLVTRLL